MERSCIQDVFEKEGKVLVKGWVSDSRDLSKIRFIVLRDSSGIIQITGISSKTDKKIFDLMDSITRESVIEVEGEVKESKQAPGGKEILPSRIEIIAKAEQPLPIDVSDFSKTELPKRLDYRFLDMHRKRIQAIFKIQSTIATTFIEHFVKKGFMNVQLPSIISTSSEGGTELFPVKYFEKKAYLAQSPQLYKQMIACAVEKVVTITPVWRAEKHNTIRHLNESRQMDIEVAFADQFSIMKEEEEVVREIVKRVLEKNKDELQLLDLKLKIPKGIYLSYSETMKKLGVKEGQDLTPEQERKICEMYPGDLVFIHSWPSHLRGFYIMRKNEDAESEETEGFDCLYKGVEITSGGQRIHIPELLEKMLEKKGLNSKNFKYYIDSFRYGAPPHAGWSIGLERFTTTLLELDNIRESVLFPRDRDRLTP
jgi:nondiscriminating aspartyl-tRNA synthetase